MFTLAFVFIFLIVFQTLQYVSKVWMCDIQTLLFEADTERVDPRLLPKKLQKVMTNGGNVETCLVNSFAYRIKQARKEIDKKNAQVAEWKAKIEDARTKGLERKVLGLERGLSGQSKPGGAFDPTKEFDEIAFYAQFFESVAYETTSWYVDTNGRRTYVDVKRPDRFKIRFLAKKIERIFRRKYLRFLPSLYERRPRAAEKSGKRVDGRKFEVEVRKCLSKSFDGSVEHVERVEPPRHGMTGEIDAILIPSGSDSFSAVEIKSKASHLFDTKYDLEKGRTYHLGKARNVTVLSEEETIGRKEKIRLTDPRQLKFDGNFISVVKTLDEDAVHSIRERIEIADIIRKAFERRKEVYGTVPVPVRAGCSLYVAITIACVVFLSPPLAVVTCVALSMLVIHFEDETYGDVHAKAKYTPFTFRDDGKVSWKAQLSVNPLLEQRIYVFDQVKAVENFEEWSTFVIHFPKDLVVDEDLLRLVSLQISGVRFQEFLTGA